MNEDLINFLNVTLYNTQRVENNIMCVIIYYVYVITYILMTFVLRFMRILT